MVSKLRRKFVITAMSALLVILVVLISVINVANLIEVTNSADSILKTLADNDGAFPENGPMFGSGESGFGSSDMAPPENGKQEDNSQEGNSHENNSSGDNSSSSDESGDSSSKHMSMEKGSSPHPGSSSEGNSGPPEPRSMELGRNNLDYTRNMETPFSTRYFWVRFNESGEAIEIDTSHIAAVSETIAGNMAADIYGTSHTKGYKSSYRYYVKEMETGGTLILFKDCSSDLSNSIKLLRNSFILMFVCLIAMFILVWTMSGHAVYPVVESLEKQKRFITDAGHELKTPLAVISANVDVIELDNGKSEWTQSIKNQVNRMTALVKNMLTLSRMEEENVKLIFSDIDLSSILMETAKSFEAVAESSGKKYSIDIESGVHIKGDKNSMTQLASLLIDNAMKYSSDEGNISVRMNKGRHIEFEVSNTCDNMPDGDLDRLFDRFYRADTSRNRKSGGYGIGLSVARAIAVSHGGNIEAIRDGDDIIRFLVMLPNGKN